MTDNKPESAPLSDIYRLAEAGDFTGLLDAVEQAQVGQPGGEVVERLAPMAARLSLENDLQTFETGLEGLAEVWSSRTNNGDPGSEAGLSLEKANHVQRTLTDRIKDLIEGFTARERPDNTDIEPEESMIGLISENLKDDARKSSTAKQMLFVLEGRGLSTENILDIRSAFALAVKELLWGVVQDSREVITETTDAGLVGEQQIKELASLLDNGVDFSIQEISAIRKVLQKYE